MTALSIIFVAIVLLLGFSEISDAINNLAQAVRELGDDVVVGDDD